MAKTGDRVSSLAGKWATVTAGDISDMTDQQIIDFAKDVRSMAASLRRQDEHKGLRGFLRIVGIGSKTA